MLRRKIKNGQSVMEYMVLIIFILSAFLVFQKYIVRAISGRWKMIGDSWGSGKVYDPEKTEECAFDFRFTEKWYSKACYEKNHCDCESAIGVTQFYDDCRTCVESCVDASPMCN